VGTPTKKKKGEEKRGRGKKVKNVGDLRIPCLSKKRKKKSPRQKKRTRFLIKEKVRCGPQDTLQEEGPSLLQKERG